MDIQKHCYVIIVKECHRQILVRKMDGELFSAYALDIWQRHISYNYTRSFYNTDSKLKIITFWYKLSILSP